MQMIGEVIFVLIALVFMGFVWWAISDKLWPMITPYVKEPFVTLIVIVFVFLLIVIVVWAIVSLLAVAGVHVPFIPSGLLGKF